MEQVFLYRFYIGSNNKTGKTETDKAIKILNFNGVKGFTLYNSNIGIWENQKENSFILEVISNKENPFSDLKAKNLKAELEKELKQFLVLGIKEQVNLF